MNGDGAAPQAKLCDLMPQLIERLTQPAPSQPINPFYFSDERALDQKIQSMGRDE
jgi:hypothetical protein